MSKRFIFGNTQNHSRGEFKKRKCESEPGKDKKPINSTVHKDDVENPRAVHNKKYNQEKEIKIDSRSPIFKELGLRRIFDGFCRYVIPLQNLLDLGYPVPIDRNRAMINCTYSPLLYGNYNQYQTADYLNHSYNHNNSNTLIKNCEPIPLYTVCHRSTYQNYFYSSPFMQFQVTQRMESNISYVKEIEFSNIVNRICVRCGLLFQLCPLRGFYVTKTSCIYHWGKLKSFSASPKGNNYRNNSHQQLYECCQKEKGSFGCTKAESHVWNGIIPGKINGPFEDFIWTVPRRGYNYGKIKFQDKILGLDCEMCYTAKGLEACKVTIVNLYGKTIYDYFIKPESPIVDYNTRFSGIKESDFSEVNKDKIKNLKQVQWDLLKIIPSDTILTGHSLEHDLRVLKIIHCNIVDTSVAFPHYYGLPYRQRLKTLACRYLNRDIQDKINGHDSYEDAKACIDLMLWKIKDDFLRGA